MILADGQLGQMMEPVVLPPARDLASLPEKPWATTGTGMAREHNVVNSLYLTPEKLEQTNIERFARYDRIRATEQRAESYLVDDAELVVVAFGASARIARSAVKKARSRGLRVGLVRPITLWPFPEKAIEAALASGARAFLSVEMNMGQMVDDVRLVVNGRAEVDFFGHTGGIIPTPAETLEHIEALANRMGIKASDAKAGE
jgi:2-oxoglutarate ferredoxin oxidoreductase subunit alpha